MVVDHTCNDCAAEVGRRCRENRNKVMQAGGNIDAVKVARPILHNAGQTGHKTLQGCLRRSICAILLQSLL